MAEPMTFSSPAFFLFFLPACLLGFQILGRFGRRAAIGFLAMMSIVFYAEWSTKYLVLLLGSIMANYLFSMLIDRTRSKPKLQGVWLVTAIVANISVLCYYKYLFPLLSFTTKFHLSHHEWGSVILPLGISFFTFTQIAYLIDLKQGAAEPQSLLSYTLFVTYFPHLIAGPIIHHKEMMPQFSEKRRYQLNRDDMAVGLTWFTMGMFKKIMVADRISPIADRLFTDPRGLGASTAWLGALVYSMQLYFDFSGYSDMAVGLARMFSIRFPFNFNSPYKAASIIDFWQRWHMTLTSYIMDYVYGPIQFRVSRKRLDKGKKISRKALSTPEGFIDMVAVPTVITMFLAGVWHGAGLQFLVFGVLHGTFLVINHAWRIFVPRESKLQKPLITPVNICITYLAVLSAEVFFRADRVTSALRVFVDMSGKHGLGPRWSAGECLLVVALFAVVWMMPNTQEILGETRKDDRTNWSVLPNVRWSPNLAWWAATTATFALNMFYSTANSTFLYFQF
jgi:alginate O-acetyltransferase complex protein AlgI